jgi:conjugal transfer pilus assembly protein TraF
MRKNKSFTHIIVIFLCLACVTSNCFSDTFFNKHQEGWHWYQDPLPEEIPPEEKTLTVEPVPCNAPLSPTAIVKAYQQELEKRLHTAWVNPTPKNVQAYQEIQRDLMGRSEYFSNVWMQVLYQNPHLDHTIGFPVNQKGRHIYLDNEKKIIQETIQSLKESFGLFYFFKGDCAYCEAFSSIVQQFSQSYGWEVLAISVDGSVLPGFKQVVIDNGLFAKLNPEVLPALFAVNPEAQDILPIAYGITPIEEIENRIMTLVSTTGDKR